jgi:twitching motility two-component system response regulator PilG
MTKKILLVEDTKSIQNATKRFITEHNDKFELRFANDGYEAIAMIQQYQPDIVFLDVQMPRMNGLETCEILKSMPVMEDVPIVMLSGMSSPIDKVRGQAAGANDYLSKPFSATDFIECIFKNLKMEM